MSADIFLNGRVQLCCGDSLHFLRDQPNNRYDSIVTDPPYALVSIVKRFGSPNAVPAKGNDAFMRASRGFMGKQWDTGEMAFSVEFWFECLRVLKPGGHVVAFGGTRTYHRLACAIEDAGFEIRDQLQWIFGSGFPKSLDVSKGIDRAAGVEREKLAPHGRSIGTNNTRIEQGYRNNPVNEGFYTAPATAAAREWEGWGTALKPACEPICLARKPLSENTVAANVLRWGTGALNINATRIVASIGDYDHPGDLTKRPMAVNSYMAAKQGDLKVTQAPPNALGRWPANVLHDGSDEVVRLFPESDLGEPRTIQATASIGYGGSDVPFKTQFHGGAASAARFFYSAKADSDDRLGSKHPTVKPVDLMQWLVRLVTPKGGLVLDPFAGTGTTAEACYREGTRCMLIEREAEYQADIRRRMALVMSGPDERSRESVKARMKEIPMDDGPLFQWRNEAREAAE